MKKLLILAAVLAAPGLVMAQGGLYFNTFKTRDVGNNLPAVNTPVYVAYVGSTIPGNRASGTAYNIAVFAGGNGSTAVDLGSAPYNTVAPGTPGSLVSAGSGMIQGQFTGVNVVKQFLTAAGSGFTAAGGNVQFPGLAVGTANVSIQLRAWSANMGSTWDAAVTAWQAHPGDAAYVIGVSQPVTITLGDISLPKVPRLGNDGISDVTYSTSANIGGFAMVTSVPEPSVMALAGLGLVGAFLIRRRK